MGVYLKVTTLALLLVLAPARGTGAPWDASYFPNVPLVSDEGQTLHFFDDLIKDKVVSINFIYTTCVDICPLETAQLVKVQRILGERLGKDVFFYSISIDPELDTPEVLAEYKKRFGANWKFLTGDEADIINLRRKLGLYVEEIQDGSKNHNVNMIIGNQATGRWMKRSPFENPHVLADQLGNWLTDWKAPQKGNDYASAPELRSVPHGEQLFRTRCATCHTINGVETDGALGPDLLGVTRTRDKSWLLNWLRAPDQMLAKKDPIAMALFSKYNELTMPNMRLTQRDAQDVLDYMDSEFERLGGDPETVTRDAASTPDVVGIMNAWVRETDTGAKANAGYARLINVASDEVTLIRIESEAFREIEMHEMATVDGLMKMRQLSRLSIPANGSVEFSPGGRHLMMQGPRKHLTAGESIDMTLIFKSGSRQTISVAVASR